MSQKGPLWPKPARRKVGIARALSKLGYCSRSQAWALIQAGRVRINGMVRRDPEWPVDLERDRFEVDEQKVSETVRVYLALNKPRGLVTTASDEQGRETVFACLAGHGLPHISPVGRLDKASEGLLLLTNDSAWAARITAPESQIEKIYHVQIECLADQSLVQRMLDGVTEDGDRLTAKRVSILRQGTRNSWLEVILDEGKNRHIRRMLSAFGVGVLRLMRVAIGPLKLGNLPKGQFRRLTSDEVKALG
jgi:23S rRNA pseudouridine2605 synthase